MMPRTYATPSRQQPTQKSRQPPELSPLAISSQQPEWIQSDAHNNALYQGDHDYYDHWQQATRSSPIAIIRNPDKAHDQPEASDADDDSVIDVELDAIKLQEKYGDNIVAASYQGDAMLAKSLLRAPYLGSLNRSENYVSLPPMSLSVDDAAEPEPPIEIVGYGSLRDSHQRGKFLDGPASYRDRSGQIRRLDARVRFQGSLPSSVSIGERMQQARKKQEDQKKKTEVATSSLSAIMDQVIKKEDENDNGKEPGTDDSPLVETEKAVAALKFNDLDLNDDYGNDDDPPNMMSTSLTGIEVLMAAHRSQSRGLSSSYAPTHSGFLLQPPLSLAADANNNNQHQYAASYSHTFQPLSRSMSDPTPNFHNSLHNSNSNLPSIPQQHAPQESWNNYTDSSTLPTPSIMPHLDDPHLVGYGASALSYDMASPDHQHDPDIDGAFGDIDME